MRVFSVLSALFASVALVAADGDAVRAQLVVIQNYTDLLGSDVSQFTDTVRTLPFALQVQQDAVLLYRAVNLGASLAQSSPRFGQPNSFRIAATLLAISNDVQSTLNKIQNKQSAFADLGPIVLASLYSLKNGTDAFASATIAKLDPIEATVAPAVVNGIDNAFNRAIVAYGGKGKPHFILSHLQVRIVNGRYSNLMVVGLAR